METLHTPNQTGCFIHSCKLLMIHIQCCILSADGRSGWSKSIRGKTIGVGAGLRPRDCQACPNRRLVRIRSTSKHQRQAGMSEAPESIVPANKRRRVEGSIGGANARLCPHCGRTFKRTEHLSRHVRTRKYTDDL
jgi:DNA-directed RNA polymerase subunit RPC12/RpoP